jgi:hypothetical protein
MAKKKAPAQLTDGAGFRYEDYVAARFLLDLLGGTNSLGPDFGRVTRVDWQARDAGWLAEDLSISCKLFRGMEMDRGRRMQAARIAGGVALPGAGAVWCTFFRPGELRLVEAPGLFIYTWVASSGSGMRAWHAAAEAPPIGRSHGCQGQDDEVAADVGDMKKATRRSLVSLAAVQC